VHSCGSAELVDRRRSHSRLPNVVGTEGGVDIASTAFTDVQSCYQQRKLPLGRVKMNMQPKLLRSCVVTFVTVNYRFVDAFPASILSD